jgi:FdhE protein
MIGHINNETLNRLEKEGKGTGLPPRFLEFHRRLLGIQSATASHIGAVRPTLDQKTANERIKGGVPLITPDELNLDRLLLKDTFDQIAATIADYTELFGGFPGKLKGPESVSAFNEPSKARLYPGGPPDFSLGADNIEYSLTEAVFLAALKPFLVAYSKAFSGFVNQKQWRRGYCPICGGRADFGFLDRVNGARWLVCCCCDAQWLFQRLQCPFCDNHNQDFLAYFADKKGIYRLYVCEQCHTYVKAIDLRYASKSVCLPLERILTINMDAQGQQNGYKPPPVKPMNISELIYLI